MHKRTDSNIQHGGQAVGHNHLHLHGSAGHHFLLPCHKVLCSRWPSIATQLLCKTGFVLLLFAIAVLEPTEVSTYTQKHVLPLVSAGKGGMEDMVGGVQGNTSCRTGYRFCRNLFAA